MHPPESRSSHAEGGGRRAPSLPGVALTILVGMPFLAAAFGVPSAAYLIPIGLLLLSVVFRAFAGGVRIPRDVLTLVVMFALFLLWMMASAIWSSTGAEVGDDLLQLTSLLVVVLATAAAFDPASADAAIDWLIAASLVVAGYIFWIYLQAGSLSGFGLLRGQYLVVAQVVGIGAVLASLRAMTGRGGFLPVASAIVLLGALTLSLARGALVGALLVVAGGGIYVALHTNRPAWSVGSWLTTQVRRTGLLLVVAVGIGIVILGASQVERTRMRLLRLVVGGEFFGGPRARLWTQAAESISAAPVLGHGLGSSGLMAGTTEDLHPHNWLLQVWLDGGIVAVVLCLLALVLAPAAILRFGRAARAERRGAWLPILGAYTFLLLEYAKSSDFYTARSLFALAVLVAYAVRPGPHRPWIVRWSPDPRAARAGGSAGPIAESGTIAERVQGLA